MIECAATTIEIASASFGAPKRVYDDYWDHGYENAAGIGRHICFTLMLLGLVFVPFYIKSGVSTLPEFIERRYCPQARTFLAVIGLLGALLIHIGISLFAAAKLVRRPDSRATCPRR